MQQQPVMGRKEGDQEFIWYYSWLFTAQQITIDERLNTLVSEQIKKQLINATVTSEGICQNSEELIKELQINIQIVNGPIIKFRAIPEQFPKKPLLITPQTKITALFDNGSRKVKKQIDQRTADEIKNFIEQEIEFSPDTNTLQEAIKQFQNLYILKKEEILDELKHFFTVEDSREIWSEHFYGKVLPIIDFTKNKAPVLVFAGDPGTGKTALAFSIGAKISESLQENLSLWSISIAVRGTGYQGRSATMVAKLFDYAKHFAQNTNKPLLIVFDEAEAIVGSRINAGSNAGAEENVAIVNAIIRGIDQIAKEKYRIAVIFISNIPIRIDEALMRRCRYYWFPRPDRDTRKEIFSKALEGTSLLLSDIENFVNATDPKKDIAGKEYIYTASDIIEGILDKAVNTCIQQKKVLDSQTILDICYGYHPTGFPKSST